jgi:hypothetical protein
VADQPPSSDALRSRSWPVALLLYGAVAAVCWLWSRRYADELGGLWVLGAGIVTSLGTLALGALLWFDAQRWLPAAKWYAALLLATAVAVSLASKTNAVAGATLVAGTALLLGSWGRPGKVRTAVASLGLVGCALLVTRHVVRLQQTPPLVGPPVVFELTRVDDRSDVLASVTDLPSDAGLATETVASGEIRFLRFSAGAGERFPALRRRADGWVGQHLSMPEGIRLAWGHDPEQQGLTIRSYLLDEPSFITPSDVVDASVSSDAGRLYVVVSLGAEAAERMRQVTAQHVGRRLAILLDGIVQVAPTVVSEISGGRVMIALAEGSTRDEAEGLATGIRGRLLHGP